MQKRLSPKYLYDERGSQLFDEICALPEYYQTRTELALLQAHGPEIGTLVPPRANVVELGAGSSRKAQWLLACLESPESYLPVDISAAYLQQQAAEVAARFPALAVQPVAADFTSAFTLPRPLDRARTLTFFPGSTIGNLARIRAVALLAALAQRVGGTLLIGFDICRDPAVLHAAYNDSRGVTAAFNLNVLARLNRELGADFDLETFRHDAVYDARHARIEMRLVSWRPQSVSVAGVPLAFRASEHIVSEHSHKYTPEAFAALAEAVGWRLLRRWIDDDVRYCVSLLRAP